MEGSFRKGTAFLLLFRNIYFKFHLHFLFYGL